MLSYVIGLEVGTRGCVLLLVQGLGGGESGSRGWMFAGRKQESVAGDVETGRDVPLGTVGSPCSLWQVKELSCGQGQCRIRFCFRQNPYFRNDEICKDYCRSVRGREAVDGGGDSVGFLPSHGSLYRSHSRRIQGCTFQHHPVVL